MAKPPFRAFEARPDFLGAFGLLETGDGVLLVANRRVIGGAETLVWDLPGGGVEPGETLAEALRREMREECALDVAVGPMLFVSEGERLRGGARTGVWRSFFFAIEADPRGIDHSGDDAIEGHRFAARAELPGILTAPYHRGFLTWLASGGTRRHVADVWSD